MEREVGGGTGMGNTCKPLAVSFQCMTKSTTKKKKKKSLLEYTHANYLVNKSLLPQASNNKLLLTRKFREPINTNKSVVLKVVSLG